jgi:hypothetical protein
MLEAPPWQNVEATAAALCLPDGVCNEKPAEGTGPRDCAGAGPRSPADVTAPGRSGHDIGIKIDW